MSQRTISEDLRNLEAPSKLKPAKTASNPKSAGRPKGSGRTSKRGKGTPKQDKAREIVRDMIDAGEPISTIKLQKVDLSVVSRALTVSTGTIIEAILIVTGNI